MTDTAVVAELRRYVETLEAARHADGWDEPARLYRVHRGSAGVLDADEVRLDLFHYDPVASVQMLAYAFEQAVSLPDLLRRAFGSIQHPTLAFCSIHEAWEHRFGSRAERDEWMSTEPRRRFADMPGSIEIRFAVVVVGRKVLSYLRERGESPKWVDDRPVTDEMLAQERLTGALVRLTRADRLVVAAR